MLLFYFSSSLPCHFFGSILFSGFIWNKSHIHSHVFVLSFIHWLTRPSLLLIHGVPGAPLLVYRGVCIHNLEIIKGSLPSLAAHLGAHSGRQRAQRELWFPKRLCHWMTMARPLSSQIKTLRKKGGEISKCDLLSNPAGRDIDAKLISACRISRPLCILLRPKAETGRERGGGIRWERGDRKSVV